MASNPSYYEIRDGVKYSKRTGKPVRKYVKKEESGKSAPPKIKASSKNIVGSKRKSAKRVVVVSSPRRVKGTYHTARKTNQRAIKGTLKAATSQRTEIISLGKDVLLAAVQARGGNMLHDKDVKEIVHTVRMFLNEVDTVGSTSGGSKMESTQVPSNIVTTKTVENPSAISFQA